MFGENLIYFVPYLSSKQTHKQTVNTQTRTQPSCTVPLDIGSSNSHILWSWWREMSPEVWEGQDGVVSDGSGVGSRCSVQPGVVMRDTRAKLLQQSVHHASMTLFIWSMQAIKTSRSQNFPIHQNWLTKYVNTYSMWQMAIQYSPDMTRDSLYLLYKW